MRAGLLAFVACAVATSALVPTVGMPPAARAEEDYRWAAKYVVADDNMNCVPDKYETQEAMAVRIVPAEGIKSGLTPTRAVVYPRTIRNGERLLIYINTPYDTVDTEISVLDSRRAELGRLVCRRQCTNILGVGWPVTAHNTHLIVRIETPVDTLEARVRVTS